MTNLSVKENLKEYTETILRRRESITTYTTTYTDENFEIRLDKVNFKIVLYFKTYERNYRVIVNCKYLSFNSFSNHMNLAIDKNDLIGQLLYDYDQSFNKLIWFKDRLMNVKVVNITIQSIDKLTPIDFLATTPTDLREDVKIYRLRQKYIMELQTIFDLESSTSLSQGISQLIQLKRIYIN